MSTDDSDDYKQYRTFKNAVAQWMEDHAHRFVIPSTEHWPDDIDNSDDALDHYSKQATDEIIDNWNAIVQEDELDSEP